MTRRRVIFTFLAVASVVLIVSVLRPATAKDELWKAMGIQKIGPVNPPDFYLEDTSGMYYSLESFRGKIVVLNFWAIRCDPCKEEMPYLEKLHEKLKGKGLAVVAIDDYESMEEVMDFLETYPYSFKILVDEEGFVSEEYKVFLIPTTIIINREGKAVGKAIGMRRWDSAESIMFFEELLGK